jgi:histidine triad (HIT) family protein
MCHDCIFCKIVHKKTETNILYEDKTVAVFRDINPQAPIHLLIVPKSHIKSINELSNSDTKIVAKMIMVGRKMAEQENINRSGYKLLFNVEKGGGQIVFHLHLHLIGGWR